MKWGFPAPGKIVPTLALIAAGLLFILGLGTVIYGTGYYTKQVVRDSRIQALIVASTVTAALAFDDTKAAEEYLHALKVNPAVQVVAIYRSNGQRFVSFSRDGMTDAPLLVPRKTAATHDDRLDVVVPVEQSGRRLGFVFLQTEIEPISQRILLFGTIALLVIMTSIIVAGLAASQSELTRANTELERHASELSDANVRLQFQIDQREKAEAALHQSQKMEAIGQLTGGIAHDFNNLLQIISGSLDMLRRRSAGWTITGDRSGDFERLLHAADEGGKRAAALTHQLLAFSRRQPLAPKVVDVKKLVLEISDLVGRTLGETISIETIHGAGVWPVWTDPNQLEAAILNLAVNARDAMPDGGKLTIETTNVHVDERYAGEHDEIAVGQYVVIAITDSGIGMSKEVAAQVFEPFFTTKQPGKGTGLGLSQVYGFTKQSGGHVKIYSEVGQGTTVKIYLPRFVGEDENLHEHATGPSSTAHPPSEIILVVEDEHGVRAASVEMLRDLGYTVFEAVDAAAALRLLHANPGIQLLFTDVVLPGGMNGRQLADEAYKTFPGLRVIYTTGYARNAIVHHGRLDPGVDLITKPFTYSALSAKIREVLDRNDGAAG